MKKIKLSLNKKKRVEDLSDKKAPKESLADAVERVEARQEYIIELLERLVNSNDYNKP